MQVKQRADLTHKHNQIQGRHGWLRLTPAYSVKVVNDIIASWPQGTRILDPFSGTATTPLCAASMGYKATSIDINPFLVWLGQAKVAVYTQEDIDTTQQIASYIFHEIATSDEIKELSALPSLYNIERWWDTRELNFLCKLKACIESFTQQAPHSRTLLFIAFCRTMIRMSNASFAHQSMSFKDTPRPDFLQLSFHEMDEGRDLVNMYCEDVAYILKTAAINPLVSAEVIQGDSRDVASYLTGTYDLIVTSPPYPNRMSYIREVRPYMYWLGYFNHAHEAGELDWQAIGGTWGIATSRLTQWQQSRDTYHPPYFRDIITRISSSENKHSKLLAHYIERYFEDIWSHLQSIMPVFASGGQLHYIVGNSTFYNILLPVEKIYRDMMLELGLTDVSVKTLRKRNSKKELFEYEVCGCKR